MRLIRSTTSTAGSDSDTSLRPVTAWSRQASAHDAASTTARSSCERCVTHELEIVGQAPQTAAGDEMDGGGSQHRIVVMNQLRQRVLGIARPAFQIRFASRTFSAIGVSSRIGSTRLRTIALEQIVEVLDGRGPAAPLSLLDGVARGSDIVHAVEQANQTEDPVERARQLVVERPDRAAIRGRRRAATGCAAASGSCNTATSRARPGSR